MKYSDFHRSSAWHSALFRWGHTLVLATLITAFGCAEDDANTTLSASETENEGPTCAMATWTRLPMIHVGATVEVVAPDGLSVQTSIEMGILSMPSSPLSTTTQLAFNHVGTVTTFVATDGPNCSQSLARMVVEVVYAYPGSAETANYDGVAMESSELIAWATGWSMPINYGEEVVELWQTPELAMGPATGNARDIVSLGREGQIDLHFDGVIFNGEGPDFAVFENSFSATFLELGQVSVSSDGANFVDFPVVYLGTETVDAYGDHDPEIMYGFAGRHQGGEGTPFDLDTLRYESLVTEGIVDLDNISIVRITDIAGDGRQKDSFGNPIFDPYPTTGSAGFDLDAVGVFHLRERDEADEVAAEP